MGYQLMEIDQEFDQFESIFVEGIKNFLRHTRAVFKDMAESNFSVFSNPLKQAVNQVEAFYSTADSSLDMGEFLMSLRDRQELTSDHLLTLVELEKDIEKVKAYVYESTSNAEYEKVKDFYLNEYADYEHIVAHFTSEFKEAYMPIIDSVFYDWTSQLERIFKEIKENSWKQTAFVVDASQKSLKRPVSQRLNIESLNECHDVLNVLQGKHMHIEILSLNLDSKLYTNPNSIKFLHAMLKAMNLTVTVSNLQFNACNNQIGESNFIDICTPR